MAEFTIHELPLAGGIVALSPLPGRGRHYAADLTRLLDWRPDMVVSMVELPELARKGAAGLPDDLAAAVVSWRHLPVPDYGLPGPEAEAAWPGVVAEILALLAGGGRVLIHCFGGCGRSGMAMLRLMIAVGEEPGGALSRLRRTRPCAIETPAQLAWAKQG